MNASFFSALTRKPIYLLAIAVLALGVGVLAVLLIHREQVAAQQREAERQNRIFQETTHEMFAVSNALVQGEVVKWEDDDTFTIEAVGEPAGAFTIHIQEQTTVFERPKDYDTPFSKYDASQLASQQHVIIYGADIQPDNVIQASGISVGAPPTGL